MMSASALAMPMAMMPMPGTTGTFTATRALGLIVLSSSMNFTRFCTLADLDLDQVGGIDRLCRDPEATRCNLNAAVERISTQQIGDFTALAVERKHIQTECSLGIGAIRDLTLRTKR